MLSRALSLATVMLLIGCLTAGVARAVENLDAGKSPSQIFSNTCSACHKSPRGLLKNTPASSLPGFLRQHYTTGTDMAAVLSSYLISNGAADPRYQSKDQPRKDARKDARQDPRQDEGPDQQPDRFGRRQRSARHLRRRLPGRMPTQHGRKARAHVQAATRSGTDGHARRPTPPCLQMGSPRCRLRPTANRASGRSRAGVAGPWPKSRQKSSGQLLAMPRRKMMRRGMPPRQKPARWIPPSPVLPSPILILPNPILPRPTQPTATGRPVRRRSPQGSGRARADPRAPRSMLPGRTSAASPIRSGPIRCRRSPLRRLLPQRPRLIRPRQRHQRRR